MAMMAIAAVYEPYQVRRLNHGIGYATAAIELILPTYAAQRGLKGKVARHFVLNPHPTLIPAIEAGFVDSVYCFGSELGMERYVAKPRRHISGRRRRQSAVQPRARAGRRPICLRPVHRRHVADRCAGQQLDRHQGPDHRLRRRAEHGRRPAWPPPRQSRPGCAPGRKPARALRGRKLVVQMVQTRQPNGAPSFVERLDAFDLAASAGFALPPVMIYGDDVTHVITEQGVANLLRCRSPQEREAALARRRRRYRVRQTAVA